MVHVIIIILVKWSGRVIHDTEIGPSMVHNVQYTRPERRVSGIVALLLLLCIHKSTTADPPCY